MSARSKETRPFKNTKRVILWSVGLSSIAPVLAAVAAFLNAMSNRVGEGLDEASQALFWRMLLINSIYIGVVVLAAVVVLILGYTLMKKTVRHVGGGSPAGPGDGGGRKGFRGRRREVPGGTAQLSTGYPETIREPDAGYYWKDLPQMGAFPGARPPGNAFTAEKPEVPADGVPLPAAPPADTPAGRSEQGPYRPAQVHAEYQAPEPVAEATMVPAVVSAADSDSLPKWWTLGE